MKPILSAIAITTLLASSAQAGNLTRHSVEKAREVIDAAVEAYGGADTLSAMQSVVIEHKTVNIASGQSRGTTAPWDRNEASGMDAFNAAENIYVTRNVGYGGGFEFDNATVLNGEEGYNLNYRGGTATPIQTPDFNNTTGPFIRVTPALLVQQLSTHARTAHYLGKAKVDGKPHDVVTFAMEVGPAISLYFDQATHILNKSERVIPGFGLIEYRFDDYYKVADIPFNRGFRLFLEGEPNMERKLLNTKVNVPVEDFTQVDSSLARLESLAPDTLSVRELADGVHHIGGSGTYAMFVDMGEYIVAVGGTGGIPQRIEELRKAVPDKPIKYAVMTHHHNDHVLGVVPYADEGATVIAAEAHAQVMRDTAGEDRTLALETVGKRKKVFKDNGRKLEIIDIGPTEHTEHLLVAYLPKEGIVFEADHFAMPRTGPVPPAVTGTRSFARALKAKGIKANTIVSAHSPKPGTMADLREAINKSDTLLSAQSKAH